MNREYLQKPYRKYCVFLRLLVMSVIINVLYGLVIGRIVAEAPILWSPKAKSRLTRKDTDAGRDPAKGEQASRG